MMNDEYGMMNALQSLHDAIEYSIRRSETSFGFIIHHSVFIIC